MKHTRKLRSKKRGGGSGGLCTSAKTTEHSPKKNTYKLGNKFGSSTWFVYKNEINPAILIKKVGPVGWLSKEEIEMEFKVAQKASELGVGPEVHYWCVEDSGTGYIVMDKIEGETLTKLFGKDPKNVPVPIIEEIIELLKILYKNGLDYHDRHLGNFMIGTTQTSPVPRVWIIDYDGITLEKNIPVSKQKFNFFK